MLITKFIIFTSEDIPGFPTSVKNTAGGGEGFDGEGLSQYMG